MGRLRALSPSPHITSHIKPASWVGDVSVAIYLIADQIDVPQAGKVFAVLWAMNRLWGIRVEQRSEVDGLDMAEHGTWGYPEFAGAAVVAVAYARLAATVPAEPSPQAA